MNAQDVSYLTYDWTVFQTFSVYYHQSMLELLSDFISFRVAGGVNDLQGSDEFTTRLVGIAGIYDYGVEVDLVLLVFECVELCVAGLLPVAYV